MTIDLSLPMYQSFFPTTEDPGPKPIVYGDYLSGVPAGISPIISQAIAGWMPPIRHWTKKREPPKCKIMRTSNTTIASAKSMNGKLEDDSPSAGKWDTTLAKVINNLRISAQETSTADQPKLKATITVPVPIEHLFWIEPGNSDTAWYVSGWEYEKVKADQLGDFFCSHSGLFDAIEPDVAILSADSELILETVIWQDNSGANIITKLAWPKYG